jgi:hypothetical protein
MSGSAYRCRFEANRGIVAAAVAGHPTALQIKEERIVEALIARPVLGAA